MNEWYLMAPNPGSSKIGGTGSVLLLACQRVVVHWRAITLVLLLALATLLIVQADFFDLLIFALLLIFIASQIFLDWPHPRPRAALHSR
jgi:hypothetical protein